MMKKALLAATVASGLIVPSAAAGVYLPPKPAIVKPENLDFSSHMLLGMPFTMGMLPGRAKAAPYIVSTGARYTSSSSLTSHTVSLPTPTQANDLLLMMVLTPDSTTLTVTGWSTYPPFTPSGGALTRNYIYLKEATGSDGSSVTITSDFSTLLEARAFLIRGRKTGLTTSEIAVATPATFADGTQPNSPALTPTWGAANNLWMVFGNRDASGLAMNSWPSGFTLHHTVMNTHDTMFFAFQQLNAATLDPTAFTLSATTGRACASLFAIRPA